MESQHDYKTSTGTIFGGRGVPMDIGKSQDSFDENKKLKCFNCNIYGHIVRSQRKTRR